MSSTISATLSIEGNSVDADLYSRTLGVSPTAVRQAAVEHPLVPRQSWEVHIAGVVHESIDAPVAMLLELVAGKEEILRELVKQSNLSIVVSCDVVIHADRPLYELSAVTLSGLARIGASFLLDVVDYS